jgi:hypothetical protein
MYFDKVHEISQLITLTIQYMGPDGLGERWVTNLNKFGAKLVFSNEIVFVKNPIKFEN